jgi:hypothetical protein
MKEEMLEEPSCTVEALIWILDSGERKMAVWKEEKRE